MIDAVLYCFISIIFGAFPTMSEALSLPYTPSLLLPINESALLLSTGLNKTSPDRCTQNGTWLTPNTLREDCKSALLYLYMEEMEDGGTRRLEFLEGDTKPRSHNKRVITPRKYIYRTCSGRHSTGLAIKYESTDLTSENQ